MEINHTNEELCICEICFSPKCYDEPLKDYNLTITLFQDFDVVSLPVPQKDVVPVPQKDVVPVPQKNHIPVPQKEEIKEMLEMIKRINELRELGKEIKRYMINNS